MKPTEGGEPTGHRDPVNIEEIAPLARARIEGSAWDYYAGGARDELTLRGNRVAWERMALHYRVLTGVVERNLRTQILGQPSSMPVMVAPTAFHRLAHPEGELATARAASGQAGARASCRPFEALAMSTHLRATWRRSS